MNGQIWGNGNTHVILLTKTEWPKVMYSKKYEKNGERERDTQNRNGSGMETRPNGNVVKS